ncbi:hypothetical protein SAMN05518801_11752 [Novosphingobium sp. CF614]|uniref:hypothetical protein n=1 Tax=Novosphingobium sp. CF614 TaxID=1884364 RepID=UPI0008E1EDEA|nr:hypothetical protein [Novosphingobium sp. CF614]SFG33428.1 hypothetical protein SAMN05518801_11752 [Novosphingobium sp. CF614]
MDTLTWKTARIVGHPDGDIWAAISADHFDIAAGALDTVAAAAALMKGALPVGGLVAEYLFCEALECVALAAEIEVMRAQREFLKCSLMPNTLLEAHARIEAAGHRYVSATMSALAAIADAKAVSRGFLHGGAFVAMQSQPSDKNAPRTISWETGHDG